MKNSTDFLEEIWALECQQRLLLEELGKYSPIEQAQLLTPKICWENPNAAQRDFFLEIMSYTHFLEETLMSLWQTWLKASLYHGKLEGITNFLLRNNALKPQVISLIFNLVEKHTAVNHIYQALLLLWDLQYRSALLELIAKYPTVCHQLLDEEDYKSIRELQER